MGWAAGVTSFATIWPGSISNPGTLGTVLATTSLGPLIVVLEKNALGTGSGVVVVYADTLWWSGLANLDTPSHYALLVQGLHHASGK